MKNTLLELIYIIAGLIAVMTAVYAFKDDKHPSPKGTALFLGIAGLRVYSGKVHTSPSCRSHIAFHGLYHSHEKSFIRFSGKRT